MPQVRARMLSWRISEDAAVQSLPNDTARLLFTWMIPHADNLGRLRGEPEWVLATIFPRRMNDVRTTSVQRFLTEMDALGLICWYEVDGLRYIQFRNWDKYQRLNGNMKQRSDFPAVPTTYVQRMNGVRSEVEVEVEVEIDSKDLSQANGNRTSEPDDLTPEAWFDEVFWPTYPKRPGQSKSKARTLLLGIFRKTPAPQQERLGNEIYAGLTRHKRLWNGKELDYVPHAATWLGQRRWEDES